MNKSLFPSLRWLVPLLILFPFVRVTNAGQSPDGVWRHATLPAQSRAAVDENIPTGRFQSLSIDVARLDAALQAVPLESRGRKQPADVFYLPDPKGGFAAFKIVESPVMAPELAAKYPEIKTYSGSGIDDPSATVRISKTPLGFHAQVLSPNGAFYIDPSAPGDQGKAICYRKRDFLRSTDGFRCYLESPVPSKQNAVSSSPTKQTAATSQAAARSGAQLRTYRLACAATGEYTAFHGGTVALGQAAIVTAINRVNGIYEVELSIRMELVANNNQLVYTNSGTDPYTNGNASLLLSENQSNIDAVIGNANYDIGHVFSTGGGGLASLGSVGINNRKARGETGLSNPIGDPFYVDFVAHEIGHQFAGNHTFNGDSGSCSGANRNGSTAYEPGSGSTIQAYAGICGNDNLQSSSDPYFHSVSFDEMINHVDVTVPLVGTRTATGNSVPTVSAGTDYTIPANTPFVLTASGSDADPGDVLTYNWEERDLGPQQDVNAGDNGSSPLFRSWSPTDDPSRTFPRLSDLVNNTTVIGETLPTTNRTMNFRVTVRDNASGGGGVNTDDMTVTVVNTGAPFAITAPNSAVNWPGLSSQTVIWNVAGTTGNGIDAANVSILLSTDGGLTYPHILLASTPNDGSEPVTIPDSQTTQARIAVQGDSNIFFDISDTDFTISAPVVDFQLVASPASLTVCQPDDAVYTIDVNSVSGFTNPVTLSVSGVPAGVSASFATNPVTPGNSTTMTLSNTGAAVPGSYALMISGAGGVSNPEQTTLDLTGGAPAAATLIAPANFATIGEFQPNFSWGAVADAATYQFDLATDAGFTNVVDTSQTSGTSAVPAAALLQNTAYFWRVTSINGCGNTVSTTFKFTTPSQTTLTPVCGTGLPQAIPDNNAGGVTNQIITGDSRLLSDLNISVDITHTWVGDLSVTLSHDDGNDVRSVDLVARPGLPGVNADFGSDEDNIDIILDDEGGNGPVEDGANSGPFIVGGSYTPDNPLSDFDGRTLAGTWTLTVTDSESGDTGTLDDWCLVPTVVGDGAVPVVETFAPADDSSGLPVDADLQIEFNELIQKGAGNVIIRLASDDSIVETIAVTSSAVTVNAATVTIDLSANLLPGEAYYVNIDSGAFEDLAGNPVGGIADTTTWNFTTNAGPVIPTMGEWGAIILISFMLLVGGRRIVQRQVASVR